MLFFLKCRALSDIDEATITATEDNLFAAGDYTKGEEEMEISISEPQQKNLVSLSYLKHKIIG